MANKNAPSRKKSLGYYNEERDKKIEELRKNVWTIKEKKENNEKYNKMNDHLIQYDTLLSQIKQSKYDKNYHRQISEG